MSTNFTPLQTMLLRIFAPSFLIGIGFLWFFHLPSQRNLSVRRNEFEKRFSANANLSDNFGKLGAKLISTQAEIASIDSESDKLLRHLDAIAKQKLQSSCNATQRGLQAKAIASTLEVMRLNNLVCIESAPVAFSKLKDDGTPTTPSKVPASKITCTSDGARTIYQIRVLGRFEDMRTTLLELRKAKTGTMPLSVNMDEPDLLSDQRTWTLILEIEPRI